MAPILISTGIEQLVPMQRSGDELRHISKAIGSLCVKLGHFDREDDSAMSPEELATRQTRWELGSAFERGLINGIRERYAETDPDRYVIPGELELEGMIGTPDLLDMHEEAVIEIKLTWMSSRHEPTGDKFWRYWTQGKAYARMIQWTKVQLRVAHVNGDYKLERGPTYNVWADEFTKAELKSNFRMLVSESNRMVEARERERHAARLVKPNPEIV